MIPTLPPAFSVDTIAHVAGARELAVAPNGDLFVGTSGDTIYVVRNGESKNEPPRVFVRIADAPVAGVALGDGALFVGGQFGVYRIPYQTGDSEARAKPVKIASVRTSGESRDHVTTSVAFAKKTLYASVGSSCNVCDPELDATRATVQMMAPDGKGIHAKAIRIRNAIALTVNPATETVWAGVAGQDELRPGHPYEIFDAITVHEGTADYGWPYCVERREAVQPGHECGKTVISRVVLPAYVTPIGAAFYPEHPRGPHAFPQAYWGGAFVTLHGSWHRPLRAPRVAFVPMHGDEPAIAIDWNDPMAQWREFMGGFQDAGGARSARPTGVAVAPDGDLFVSDDYSGSIFRVRYTGTK